VEGFAVGKFVSRQRLVEYLEYQNGKPSPIKQERIEKLKQIGFEWDALSAQWTPQFQLLCKYKDDNKDCLVPSGGPLGEWVRTQKGTW